MIDAHVPRAAGMLQHEAIAINGCYGLFTTSFLGRGCAAARRPMISRAAGPDIATLC
jgi:hypothetical protein